MPEATARCVAFHDLADRTPCQVEIATGTPVACAQSSRSPQEAPSVITLTDTAASKVKDLIEAEGEPNLALRVAVRPGGCSGFSYEMFFDTDVADDDNLTDYHGVRVVVDASSAELLAGRHARLQGRPPGRRVRHRQPERAAQLRLRQVLQLTLRG